MLENTNSRKNTMASVKLFMIPENPQRFSVGHCLETVAGVASYNFTEPSK